MAKRQSELWYSKHESQRDRQKCPVLCNLVLREIFSMKWYTDITLDVRPPMSVVSYLKEVVMFTTFTPEEAAYMIGMLQADGHHQESSRNRGKITLELSNKDIDIIEKLSKILKPFGATIHTRTRNTNFKDDYMSSTLSVCRLEFRTLIKPYVPVGRKSADTVGLPLDIYGVAHYVRGLSDGDGSLGITGENKPFWSFVTASESLASYLCTWIERITGQVKRVDRNTRDGVYNICLYNEDAITWCTFLYQDSTLCLDRKFNKYQEMKSWVRTIPKGYRQKRWLLSEDKLIMDLTYSIEDLISLLSRSAQSIRTRRWRLKLHK